MNSANNDKTSHEFIPKHPNSPRSNGLKAIDVDDLRVELGCFGDTPVISPNIDSAETRNVANVAAHVGAIQVLSKRMKTLLSRTPKTITAL